MASCRLPSGKRLPPQSPEEADVKRRPAQVFVYKTASHWAVVFCFDDGVNSVVELTPIYLVGLGRINWRCKTLDTSMEQWLAKGDVPYVLWTSGRELWVRTSPEKVLQLCRSNPCNGEKYDLLRQNCERWIRALLVEGLGIHTEALPISQGVRAVPVGVYWVAMLATAWTAARLAFAAAATTPLGLAYAGLALFTVIGLFVQTGIFDSWMSKIEEDDVSTDSGSIPAAKT
ncbi:unnamed protein product [Durusdinium trenchii]|uniref:LRAT domain-containing protein n=1 Tax=Durusdinium trenchii TaxID=1381693 RepID=A0ABP0QKZ5_9DINO